jgi:hypothetical protein
VLGVDRALRDSAKRSSHGGGEPRGHAQGPIKVFGCSQGRRRRPLRKLHDNLHFELPPLVRFQAHERKRERLKLTGAGQYEALLCVSKTTNTTSKALATGGGGMLYYLNEPRAMKKFAACAGFTPVNLPATTRLRQSINVQFPTVIIKNFPAFLAYLDSIRAEDSKLNRLITTLWGRLRDRHVLSALRARSFENVVFTTPMVFFTHHRLVTRSMVRTIMDAARAFTEEKLAMLSENGLAASPPL